MFDSAALVFGPVATSSQNQEGMASVGYCKCEGLLRKRRKATEGKCHNNSCGRQSRLLNDDFVLLKEDTPCDFCLCALRAFAGYCDYGRLFMECQ